MPEVLPDLGALGAALVLVLIAAGLWVAAELIRQSFGRLPLIGNWVSGNIVGALNSAAHAVLGWAGAAWHFAEQLFMTIANWCWRLSLAGLLTSGDVARFSVWVAHWLVPNTADVVRSEASSLYAGAIGYTTAVRDWAGGLISSTYHDATSYALALYQDATAYTTSVRDWAAGLLTGALSQAYSYAASLFSQSASDIAAVQGFAAAGIAAAEATAVAHADQLAGMLETELAGVAATAAAQTSAAVAGVLGGIYTDLDAVGNSAVTTAWPDVTGDLGALRGALGGDFPDIQQLLPWLAGAGVAGLSGALIRSLAGTSALTKLATDCIIPNCRNLSGFGHDLGNLLSDASTAAMLAWIVFCVTDPAGWAQETQAVAGPVADTVLAAGAHLAGAA